jgi:glutathione peroxidase
MFSISNLFATIFSISIYSFSVISIDGTNINLSQFKGKKILIVNTASTSKYVAQYGKLEQLYQKYKDSLVIIAFPSNDFNHESASTGQIKNFVTSNYHISYILASKQSVVGAGISALYKWLSASTQNGVMDNPVIEDFCKYLIDDNGNIIGVFAGSVDPMDNVIQNAITN